MLPRRSIAVMCVSMLLILAVPLGGYAAGRDPAVTPARARAEALRLADRVTEETRSNPRSVSAEPALKGAETGEPLLLRSFDGAPVYYLVPMSGSSGGGVGGLSIVGVSATSGKWCWYTDCPELEFPLTDAREAVRAVEGYMRDAGVRARVSEPEARIAPDKNTYWFFGITGAGKLTQVYLPVFVAGRPSTNLERKPWEGASRLERGPLGSGASDGGGGGGQTAGAGGQAAPPALYPGGAPDAFDIEGVPFHYQETSYWCGPAALEMLFDYWGEDVSQQEIAYVVDADPSVGCFSDNLFRAAHFSEQSTAYANPSLRGYSERSIGYMAAEAGWGDGSSLYSRRYSDLKELISRGYPVLILTHYSPGNGGHFRLVKGYDDDLGTFIVHDPWYAPPYMGPDVKFEQSFLVDTLWPYSDRWGMIAAPWEVDVGKPGAVAAGQTFTVTADVTYRGPEPMDGQYECLTNTPTATFRSDGAYQLVEGEVNQRISGIDSTGSSGTVSWTVKALESRSTDDIEITAQGLVEGYSRVYPDYSDWIGGTGTAESEEPPATTRTWGHDSVGTPVPAETWYLAEGCTAPGYETWVLVQNPNDAPAGVSLTYMTPAGPVPGPSITLPANSRQTFNVAETVPDSWGVSTRVNGTIPIIAERAMYGLGMLWGHDSIGVSSTSRTWYLAEGCTRNGFETWVLVQNPNDTPATVNLTYMTPSGPVPGQSAVVGANSRETFPAAAVVPEEWSVSTKVESDAPVIAERAMYGGGKTWGHDSIGVTAPADAWYLAEGCTNGGFETWVLVQNPNDAPADVSLTYMTPAGPVPGPTQTIGANSRETFSVANTVPDTWEVSTMVTSSRPVIAERAMYGGGRTWGHDSVGVPAPADAWYLAEGCTKTGFETWVLVQNPNDSPAEIRITFMTQDGAVEGPTETLPANSRKSYNVARWVKDNWQVSTMVTADVPVIAERAMYGDPR